MVTVMVLPAGDRPIRTEKIDGDDYHVLNRLVGGNLGTCGLPPSLRGQDFYAFCDDDARVRSNPPAPNAWATHLGHAILLGPIVIAKTDELGETRTLNRSDIAALEMYFVQDPSAEALRMARNEAAWLA
jgi:hypothetical protein